MASGKTSKNSRVDKKNVAPNWAKQKERKRKETILLPVTVFVETDGFVEGKEVIGRVKKFGHEYYLCKNN